MNKKQKKHVVIGTIIAIFLFFKMKKVGVYVPEDGDFGEFDTDGDWPENSSGSETSKVVASSSPSTAKTATANIIPKATKSTATVYTKPISTVGNVAVKRSINPDANLRPSSFAYKTTCRSHECK